MSENNCDNCGNKDCPEVVKKANSKMKLNCLKWQPKQESEKTTGESYEEKLQDEYQMLESDIALYFNWSVKMLNEPTSKEGYDAIIKPHFDSIVKLSIAEGNRQGYEKANIKINYALNDDNEKLGLYKDILAKGYLKAIDDVMKIVEECQNKYTSKDCSDHTPAMDIGHSAIQMVVESLSSLKTRGGK